MIGNNVIFIAEVKTQAPSGWRAEQSWDALFDVANEYGDWISIHTDPRWGGSMELVAEARRRTTKPILAKGIHATDNEVKAAFDAGANRVLAVGRIPEYRSMSCLIEPYTVAELRKIPAAYRAVWNDRDLRLLHQPENRKTETWEQARTAFGRGWLCQASNLRTVEDIKEGASAVLVGTHLIEFVQSLR